MKLHFPLFFKTGFLVLIVACAFLTQKTVTLVIGNQFYSISSNYRTLYSLSEHAPYPFSKFHSNHLPPKIISEGTIVHWEEISDEP